jgi:membrane associated rhomboid family serine protease
MGIYDRDYYRREGQSFLGSLTERGTMCKWLIGINVVCFILQIITTSVQPPFNVPHAPFTNALILDVHKVLEGQLWRLLTYAFLHDPTNIWHILVNMLLLYMFGRDVEDAYGPREFLAFYLVAAVLGGGAFLATMPGGGTCLGASGAVIGVLVLSACRDPHQTVRLFFMLPCPAWLAAVLLVAMDAFNFLGGVRNGIAVQAHLAGAAFAFLYYHFQWRITGWWPGFKTRLGRLGRPKLRVYDEPEEEERERQPASVSAPAPSSPATQSSLDDEQLEAKMDAILEKISRVGKDNITESEREVLLRAGERIRRRRG